MIPKNIDPSLLERIPREVLNRIPWMAAKIEEHEHGRLRDFILDAKKKMGRNNPGLIYFGGVFEMEGRHWLEDGPFFRAAFPNLVPNVSLNHILDVEFSAASQISTWYLGLKGTGTPVAADTMSSHGSWSEDQNYSESVRQTWQEGGSSSQSISNSGTPASFSINATTTIYGAFMTSVNTKGGTTGTLGPVGNFATSKAVANGDTLTVTYTIAAASS